MAAILYYLFIKPISLLPLKMLYVVSDMTCFLIYRILGYRKKIVTTNLKNSFPDKSFDEIKDIRTKFYSHFTDFLFESFRNFSITEEEALARFIVLNPEVLKPFVDTNRSVLIVGGHYTNWEMVAVGIDQYLEHQTVAIYHKLGSKFMDDKVLSSRGKFGLKLIPRAEVKSFFEETKTLTATIFGVDQSPSIAKKVYWCEFLNQDTPVMFGAEKFAKEKDYPVVYAGMKKVKRGYYTLEFDVLFAEPRECAYGEITEGHTRRLEQTILEAPQYWLWTHKRWKRKRNAEEIIEKENQMKKNQLV
jgi:Kdo2-lipid IVA lauroyltransferase/acyltransferase